MLWAGTAIHQWGKTHEVRSSLGISSLNDLGATSRGGGFERGTGKSSWGENSIFNEILKYG